MLKKEIEQTFTQAFLKAFPQLNLNEPIVVTKSTAQNFGHYQCNSAMKLSKILKISPRDIAQQVVKVIESQPEQMENIAKIEVAGPGFINISLSEKRLEQYCQKMVDEPLFGISIQKPQKIVIDYSSPNTAKEMHVGHLRSTIIGDSLANLFSFFGNDVLRLSHVGDWGTQFGMLIAYMKEFDQEVLEGKKAVDVSFLVKHYKAAKKLFDEDPNFKKNAQNEVVLLQKGEPRSKAAWTKICEISRTAYQEIYDILNVHLIERGESFYNPDLPKLITDLESKNLIQTSDGAKCLFLEGYVNREGEPLPFIVQKSDGGYNYGTTDLVAIRHRIETEKADRIIYVTDAGQATHFGMMFKAAEKAGYLNPEQVRVDHVTFGLVLGPDGKKFKTRSGETERLMDLLISAMQKAEEILIERNKDSKNALPQDELKNIAKVLGINAIKYADLSCNRNHDYVFSYDRMLRFEGNTAAFLMYSYVRIQGIKRRIQNAQAASIVLNHPSEIELGLHLCQFEELLYSIADDLMPNRLCEYLYELSEKFNAFFRDCRVEGAPEQNPRLALCDLTAKVLKQGLAILGLQMVDRM